MYSLIIMCFKYDIHQPETLGEAWSINVINNKNNNKGPKDCCTNINTAPTSPGISLREVGNRSG